MNARRSPNMRPSPALPRSRANASAPKKITVNHRHLGEVGALSHSFGTTVKSEVRDRMELKNLMVKAQHVQYKDNPIEQRRVQAQIAEKASAIYGVDSKKLLAATKGSYQAREPRIDAPGAPRPQPPTPPSRRGQSLASKVNSK